MRTAPTAAPGGPPTAAPIAPPTIAPARGCASAFAEYVPIATAIAAIGIHKAFFIFTSACVVPVAKR